MNIEKLNAIKLNYERQTAELASPEVVADAEKFNKICKELGSTQEIVEVYNKYLETEHSMSECVDMLQDVDMRDYAKEELTQLAATKEMLTAKLDELLNPETAANNKDVIMEIRAGAGGEEAALFAYDLYRMYKMWAEANGYKFEDIDVYTTELGGLKQASVKIIGQGAYGKLKYESGVHRVQRVPKTESSGRIQTSTATVAVLPEFEDLDVDLNEKDIRLDVFHSGGKGGQNVNKVATAIRITHFPTGIVVQCQDERSQLQNKERAFAQLRAKLFEYYNNAAREEYEADRKSQVGTGDRSERIRTYNFQQGRVTDHRINKSIFDIQGFLNGNIDCMLTALKDLA